VEINFDEMEAARAEVSDIEESAIIFRGERFVLPREVPIALLEHLARYLQLAEGQRIAKAEGKDPDAAGVGSATAELLKASEVILGEEQWERFKAKGATYSHLLSLLTAVIRVFKLGENVDGSDADVVGEPQASDSPSSDSGESSRQTGNGSTDATSDATSTEDASPSAVSAS